jgi:hypothetical protein
MFFCFFQACVNKEVWKRGKGPDGGLFGNGRLNRRTLANPFPFPIPILQPGTGTGSRIPESLTAPRDPALALEHRGISLLMR